MPAKSNPTNANLDSNVVIGVSAQPGQGTITARKAGGLRDLLLPVSPLKVPLAKALQNLAKAINVALTSDFLENELEKVYKTARVRKGTVEILHGDYIGLGDGVFATVGKVGKSLQLTLRGPDPASPEGKAILQRQGRSTFGGMMNFIGRKLDLVQEYEDMVPTYVEQLFDRLEAAQMIVGWSRDEWEITTRLGVRRFRLGISVAVNGTILADSGPAPTHRQSPSVRMARIRIISSQTAQIPLTVA